MPALRYAAAVPLDLEYSRQIFFGIAEYATPRGISLITAGANPAELDVRLLGVAGLITFGVSDDLRHALARWRIPAVNVSARARFPDLPTVMPDQLHLGRLGAGHLINKAFKTFAYCGLRNHYYSDLRADGFASALADHGIDGRIERDLYFNLRDPLDQLTLVHFIRDLPKPAGIMACSDIRSKHVLEACRLLNLRVPDDVAIIGVDNDPTVCQTSDPLLSSVDPNARGVGYAAAALLADLLAGKPAPANPVLVPPQGVVPRASTHTTPSSDPLVAEAVRYIRSRADQPLDVPEIAARMKLGRRTLERRFRAAVGHGIAEAIRLAHVDRAKQLLLDTDMTLDQVAEAAGFGYLRQMRMVFARHVKQSPAAFRKAFHTKP